MYLRSQGSKQNARSSIAYKSRLFTSMINNRVCDCAISHLQKASVKKKSVGFTKKIQIHTCISVCSIPVMLQLFIAGSKTKNCAITLPVIALRLNRTMHSHCALLCSSMCSLQYFKEGQVGLASVLCCSLRGEAGCHAGSDCIADLS